MYINLCFILHLLAFSSQNYGSGNNLNENEINKMLSNLSNQGIFFKDRNDTTVCDSSIVVSISYVCDQLNMRSSLSCTREQEPQFPRVHYVH